MMRVIYRLYFISSIPTSSITLSLVRYWYSTSSPSFLPSFLSAFISTSFPFFPFLFESHAWIFLNSPSQLNSAQLLLYYWIALSYCFKSLSSLSYYSSPPVMLWLHYTTQHTYGTPLIKHTYFSYEGAINHHTTTATTVPYVQYSSGVSGVSLIKVFSLAFFLLLLHQIKTIRRISIRFLASWCQHRGRERDSLFYFILLWLLYVLYIIIVFLLFVWRWWWCEWDLFL